MVYLGSMSEKSILFNGPPEPLLYQFGGDDGKRNFGDHWVLTLKDVSESEQDVVSRREAVCRWKVQTNSTAHTVWKESCDVQLNSSSLRKECRWQDILLMAWCIEQYQSFLSPL